MNKTQIATIVVVAIVIIAGAAVMIKQFTGKSDNDTVEETGRLTVYGNANNDDYMDDRDLDFLKKIIEVNNDDDTTNDIDWQTYYKYADANTDGVVDNKDVELLQKILNKEECKVYYEEQCHHYLTYTEYVNYPVKCDTIGCAYYETAFMLVILGLWDKVTDIDEGIKNRAAYGFDMTNCKTSYGSSFNKITTDAIYNSKVDLFVGHYNYYQNARTDLRNMGSDTQMMLFCTGGCHDLSHVLVLGFFTDTMDKAHEYVDFVDNIYSYLDEKLGSIPESEYVTYYMAVADQDTSNITVSSKNEFYTSPVVEWITTIPGTKNLMETGDGTSINATRSADWFLSNPSDYIFLAVSDIEYIGDTQAAADYYSEHMFKYTEAYNEKNILTMSYTNTLFAFNGPSILIMLAAILFPDYVDADYGQQVFEEFYEKFNGNGYSEAVEAYAGIYRMS